MNQKIEINESTEFPVEKAIPRQLTIWEAFGQETPPPPENITFSVDSIDDWPLVSLKKRIKESEKNYNPIVTGAKELSVTAPPGYYRTNEGTKAIASFVGEHEWKLFKVLRKMAINYGGYDLNGQFILSFTLRELARFYKESTGKVVNHGLIRKRLEVLRTAVYQIQDKRQKAHFSLLRELYITSKEDISKDGNSKCFVMFDHLTEKTLTTGKGVLIDYDLACKLSHIASWFYVKLEREGLYSGIESELPYKVWLKNTLYRVGLDNSSKSMVTLKHQTKKALIELIENGILKSFKFNDKKSIGPGRPKLLDSEITIFITQEFKSRIKSKLRSTKKLRNNQSNKISLTPFSEENITKLKKLDVVEISKNNFHGKYKRKEGDRRSENPPPPSEADWRSNEDRRGSSN